jgi:hypothetical protein
MPSKPAPVNDGWTPHKTSACSIPVHGTTLLLYSPLVGPEKGYHPSLSPVRPGLLACLFVPAAAWTSMPCHPSPDASVTILPCFLLTHRDSTLSLLLAHVYGSFPSVIHVNLKMEAVWPLKYSYPTTSLHSVITHKITTYSKRKLFKV